MMDHDEKVDYRGEMMPVSDLTDEQVHDIVVELESTDVINESHATYLNRLIADLYEELRERGWKPEEDLYDQIADGFF